MPDDKPNDIRDVPPARTQVGTHLLPLLLVEVNPRRMAKMPVTEGQQLTAKEKIRRRLRIG